MAESLWNLWKTHRREHCERNMLAAVRWASNVGHTIRSIYKTWNVQSELVWKKNWKEKLTDKWKKKREKQRNATYRVELWESLREYNVINVFTEICTQSLKFYKLTCLSVHRHIRDRNTTMILERLRWSLWIRPWNLNYHESSIISRH